MKTWKLISLLILAFLVGACDDETVTDGKNNISGGGDLTANAGVDFAYTATSVLKNTGLLLIPIKLEKAVANDVKILFTSVYDGDKNSARENIDFSFLEKILTITAGDTVGYIRVELLDNKAVNDDRVAVINITEVYGGKLGTAKTCELHILSNAFVGFQEERWTTYESATATNGYATTLNIPLKLTGTITETTVVKIDVIDITAKEYEHFDVISKNLSVNPGDTIVYLELRPKDDNLVNHNRVLNLSITTVTNGNLIIAKTNSTCEVLIISEEKVKTLSFSEQTLSMNEGEVKEIKIIMDNPVLEGEDDVKVSLVQKEGGNALLGTDYTLSIESLTFGVGETEKICRLDFVNDPQWLVDREFVLELNSPIGAELNKDADEFGVIVKSDSYLNKLTASYEIEEAVGGILIPVSITQALSENIVLSLKAIPISNAEEGAHYTLTNTSVTIPAGETTANFKLKIGYNYKWEGTPLFKVEVTHADANKSSIVASELSLTQCAYRKFLGEWVLSSTSASGMKPGVISVSSGENGEFFNKKYICDVAKDEFSKNTSYPFKWNMSYNKSDAIINVMMGEKIHVGGDFYHKDALAYITWNYYGNTTTKSITTTWKDDDTLLWNSGDSYVCLAIIAVSDGRSKGQYAWHRNNVKMTRVK